MNEDEDDLGSTCSASGAIGPPPCLARFNCSNALSRCVSLSFALTCLRDPIQLLFHVKKSNKRMSIIFVTYDLTTWRFEQ